VIYFFFVIGHSPSGDDTRESCSSSSAPCLTIARVLDLMDTNVTIKILECSFLTESTQIPALLELEITSTLESGSTATLGWDASSDSAAALLILSTGLLTIRGITVIHNSDSKGAILSIMGNGSISIVVCSLFVFMGFVL
jgi:hypothetical protein